MAHLKKVRLVLCVSYNVVNFLIIYNCKFRSIPNSDNQVPTFEKERDMFEKERQVACVVEILYIKERDGGNVCVDERVREADRVRDKEREMEYV